MVKERTRLSSCLIYDNTESIWCCKKGENYSKSLWLPIPSSMWGVHSKSPISIWNQSQLTDLCIILSIQGSSNSINCSDFGQIAWPLWCCVLILKMKLWSLDPLLVLKIWNSVAMLHRDRLALKEALFIEEIISVGINLPHPKKCTMLQTVGWDGILSQET